ncbi:MAG: hypothetical protein LKF32_04210 [Mageeibacillus sp.]|nr:hypothetical protein [Mageeibacillus sp.]MCI1769269.1 hypothetical protein [Mageeibacillus sp.]
MKTEREPRMSFWMTLYGKNIDLVKIEKLLHVKLDDNCIRVPDNLPEDPDGPVFYEEIAWLLDLIEKNEKELRDLGVDFSDSQIWMIYYYVKQCNMEFDPDLMARMGKLRLKLCVSCQEI